MSLKEQLKDALKDAMRAKDAERKMVLRGALAAIKQAEVDIGEQKEEDILAIVQKEYKGRKESIADAEKAERPDLIEAAKSEMTILEEFLPKGLTEEEVEAIVKEVIAQVGASSMADMGKVMGAVMPHTKGRADGGMVNQIVRNLLAG